MDIRINDEQPGIAVSGKKDMAAFYASEHAWISGQTFGKRTCMGEIKGIGRGIVQLFARTVKNGIFTEAFLKNTAK